MPSLLDLTNRALAELGRNNVTTIDPNDPSVSPDAVYVSNKILELYKEVLLDYEWNFAVVYVANYSPETTNFSPDYVYSYQLPGNYGRFFQWASTGAQWPLYAIMDGMLLANTLPVQYYYIANDIPFENWPPLVARLLVLYAACKSAPSITNDVKLTEYLRSEYKEMRMKAITQNDMERSVQSTPYNDFDRITFV